MSVHAPTEVMIVEEHPSVISALRALISIQPDMKLVGVVRAVKLLRLQMRMLHPDLVLIDSGMLNDNTGEMLSDLRSISPTTKLVAMSSGLFADERFAQSGFDAFVSKTEPADVLLETVRRCM